MSEDDTKPNNKSFVSGLKTEWSLFWDNLIGDDEPNSKDGEDKADPFETGRLEKLSLDKIKAITKALSSDRKLLNQRLESLNKEIDLNTAKLESLRLVGGEQEETLARLSELTDLGQAVCEKLDKINERLRLTREFEDYHRENNL